jgi:hypothetical protein
MGARGAPALVPCFRLAVPHGFWGQVLRSIDEVTKNLFSGQPGQMDVALLRKDSRTFMEVE